MNYSSITSKPTSSSFSTLTTGNTSPYTYSSLGYALGFDTNNASGTYGAAGTENGLNGIQGKYYTGYMDVVAGQQITIVVGAKEATYSVKGNGGFVKIAYGGDI